MSPGSSVIRPERWATSAGTEKIRSCGAGRLHRLPVQGQRDLDAVVRPRLVGRHERRPARGRPVEDLARHPLRRGELQVARRQVVEQHVAGDVVQGLRLRDVAAAAPDHERDLGLVVHLLAGGRQGHLGAVRREGVAELGEERGRGRRVDARPRPRACGSSGRCRRSCRDPAPAGRAGPRRAACRSAVDLGGEPVDKASLEQLAHALMRRCRSRARPRRRTRARRVSRRRARRARSGRRRSARAGA